MVGTKLDGLRAVLGAVGHRELQFLGLFGSVTGRFGRRGQSDYAAANRILDALAAREAARRPNTRVVCWSWGPWDGGMVTPELKKTFAREGVALIGRAPGARLCLEEVLAAPGRSSLIVVGDGLVGGRTVDTLAPTLEAAEEAGLELIARASADRPDHARERVRTEHLVLARKPVG